MSKMLARELKQIGASPNCVRGKGIRTLSVRQPWAWAILAGGKDVENRSRATRIRGTIALHASKRPDDLAQLERAFRRRVPEDLDLGCVLGLVDIVDCVDGARSRWAIKGAMHWCLANPRPFARPIPARGAVGFWYWLPP